MEEVIIENYRQLITIMKDISKRMPEVIFLQHFDNNKRLGNLYYESFKSIESFCDLLGSSSAVCQSAAVLRMAIDLVSIIGVLYKYPDLQDKYDEFCKFRFSIKEFSTSKQRKMVVKEYGDATKGHMRALDYIDYGWCSSKILNNEFGFHEMIKLAGFDDIYEWVDTLNMFIHGTVSFVNLSADGGDNAIEFAHYLINICAKLFDHLCCFFHNTFGFNFTFNGQNLFTEFRNIYKEI